MIEFNATFIVAMLSFVVFIFIMNAIFYNPILSIIRKREDYMESNYKDAKSFNDTAEINNNKYSTKITQTQNKCRQDIKLKVGAAQTEADENLRSAKDSFKASIEQIKHNITIQGEALSDQLEHSVVEELASTIISKLINDTNTTKTAIANENNKVLD
ncbi:MAG: hypothetical protein E7Z87_00130 [Cyanobacteria bacterium SIG26]|nr:hypothetical protein [Cyanobacteria bacterium SIG26]